MKQLFQSLRTGEVTLQDMPVPFCGPNQVLIRTTTSLVSLGTEKMLVDFGRANWIDKARQQPEKVQQVITKIKTDGLMPTLNAVQSKLDQPIPLGYSNVGIVYKVGKNISDLKVGDRVVSNASHTEFGLVSRNLVAPIPDSVSDESAAFTVVGAIALQGIRLINPTFGESIAVIGLGLLGLLTVQLLKANGCRVIGFDMDLEKVRLAKKFGAEAFVVGPDLDPVAEALIFSGNIGVDGVIITASTQSDEVISQAARMSRKKGRLVLVGVTGLDLKRSEFFEKELTFQVSCSYGPGRYDPTFEDKGLDYPIGYVRWTEQRNFQAVLNALSEKRICTDDLITNRIPFFETPNYYATLGKGAAELGILITYPADTNVQSSVPTKNILSRSQSSSSEISKGLSLIGGSQFAGAVLLPNFKKAGFQFKKLGSRSSSLGPHLAKKFQFESLTSDYDSIFADSDAKTVAITTRHRSHGELVLSALQAGKNVFVEKPLAISLAEIDHIDSFFSKKSGSVPILLVGFNRRFSPLAVALRKKLAVSSARKAFVITVNAGPIPDSHWTQDPESGGGRLVGEGCHFIDLIRFLSDSPISEASVVAMDAKNADSFSISLKLTNGDIGTIHYFSNGSKSFPKERVEVFTGGKVFVLDNFKSLSGIGVSGLIYSLKSQDKGHLDGAKAFQRAITTGIPAIPLSEIFEVSRIAVKLQNQILGKDTEAEK